MKWIYEITLAEKLFVNEIIVNHNEKVLKSSNNTLIESEKLCIILCKRNKYRKNDAIIYKKLSWNQTILSGL